MPKVNSPEFDFDVVPQSGPLRAGAIYQKADLHSRFGGNRMAGIAVSPREPVILLFHTEEPAQQYYRDGFDENGVYWYSGEGVVGDMRWTTQYFDGWDYVLWC